MFSTAMVMAGMLTMMFAIIPQTRAATISPGNAALNWAETQTGCWYSWAGTSCSEGFDCSGLVSAAFMKADRIWIGRSTYDMLSNPHLHRIPLNEIQRGDLLFYGSGHVEIATKWYHESFGAQEPGTRVGWHEWNEWWSPTMAFRVW